MQPKLTLLIAITFITASLFAQNVGIGTTSPKARLHVADSAVLFTGPVTLPATTNYPPPASGPGTRMMWYPEKAAFRAGNVNNTFWDKDSIGKYSFAIGLNTKASGYNSVSIGGSCVATGDFATSMGYYSVADGIAATSMGLGTNAVGEGATSMGKFSLASGQYSTSMGYATIAKSDNSLVTGIFNDITAGVNERLFEIGNGTFSARNNAFTVLTNGNIGIGTALPTGPLAFKNVVGNKIVLYGQGATAHYGIGIQGAALQLYADVPSSNILFGSGSSGSFAERMRIFNNGADGLQLNGRIILKNGTGSPNDPPGIWFYKADNSAQLGFFGTRDLQNIGFYGGPAGWGFVYDALNSRVGIGTVTPSQALQVVGNILASGTITPSDARYKKNISTITAPLEKLSQLNGVTYNYRSADFPGMKFSDQQQVGLIAQDVEKVFPELVFEDDKGYKAVDYVKLIPLLVESIKTQQQQIDRQQKIQQQQQQEMDALKQEIKILLKNK